jgi:hypothetical protein
LRRPGMAACGEDSCVSIEISPIARVLALSRESESIAEGVVCVWLWSCFSWLPRM